MSCESETLLLRDAEPGDAASLAAIDRAAGAASGRDSRPETAPTASRYDQICEQGTPTTGLLLVAERAGRLCGFVLYTLVLDEGSINNIVVVPDLQGRGFGRQLLRRSLAKMQQAGAVRCLLEVRASNTAARALYESEGFTLDGRRPGYYLTGPGVREDALLMSMQLRGLVE